MSWVYTVLGISALVILHELGHFTAAKAVGMRVERFSLFFGPMIVKVRRGETDYGIGVIPLGGYVKISGMNPAEDMPEGEEYRGYYRQHVWKRLVVIAAGPAVNIVLAFVILWVVYATSAQRADTNRVRIATVEAGMPASGVLHKGDVLLAVDGKRVRLSGEDFNYPTLISSHRCAGAQVQGCAASTPARFTVQRAGRVLNVSVTPRYSAKEKRALVGIGAEAVLHTESPGQAAGSSIGQMWNVTSQTVTRVVQIFTSSAARKEVHGIVGVSDVAHQAFSFSVAQAFYVLALLSLSLAIINLFPFLPLDGGHLFWALAEKVRGRAIPFSVMERASVVGILLVMFVAIIGLSNDIGSLSDGSLNLHR
ncbi:MAG TPA: M50 family metallopeptidase [Solirubrobacteraceae bacterium]|jgi:regulator of sigma E protease|nr:M50 family metallopeptidase [Solirubrobacteraceae bacterium]